MQFDHVEEGFLIVNKRCSAVQTSEVFEVVNALEVFDEFG